VTRAPCCVDKHQMITAKNPNNRHLIGDVKIVLLGRGPPVDKPWDEKESVEAADVVCMHAWTLVHACVHTHTHAWLLMCTVGLLSFH
jgi:hypothetical protein